MVVLDFVCKECRRKKNGGFTINNHSCFSFLFNPFFGAFISFFHTQVFDNWRDHQGNLLMPVFQQKEKKKKSVVATDL